MDGGRYAPTIRVQVAGVAAHLALKYACLQGEVLLGVVTHVPYQF